MPEDQAQAPEGAGEMFASGELDILVQPVCDAFFEREKLLFDLVYEATQSRYQPRYEVYLQRGLRPVVEQILQDVNDLALLTGVVRAMLERRPGDAALRSAVQDVRPALLAAVTHEAYQAAQAMEALLEAADAAALRQSVRTMKATADELKNTKALHDILHNLQQLVPATKRLAEDRALFSMMPPQVMMLKREIGRAAQVRGAISAEDAELGWVADLERQADALEGALFPADLFRAQQATSDILLTVGDAMPEVDFRLLRLARALAAPLQKIAAVLGSATRPEPAAAPITDMVRECLDYLAQLQPQIDSGIAEHGLWQKLDRRFELISRSISENDERAVRRLIHAWPGIFSEMTRLCEGPTAAQPWAQYLVEQANLCGAVLTEGLPPPVPGETCERLSDLINRGRLRFIEVDKSLLDDLQRTADNPPRLLNMLAEQA